MVTTSKKTTSRPAAKAKTRPTTKAEPLEKTAPATPHPSQTTTNSGWKVATIVLIILLLGGGLWFSPAGKWLGEKLNSWTPLANQTAPNGAKVPVTFYVMSQCPYGVQVLNNVAPVLKKMGQLIDFKVDYIGEYDETQQTFSSLHGPKEVEGDKIELCAMKNYAPHYQYIDFILCLNKDAANLDTNLASCAKSTNLDDQLLQKCVTTEGNTLLKNSFAAAKKAEAQGSPTIEIDGQKYSGGREELDFTRAICNSYQAKFQATPAECQGIPACTKDADCTAEPKNIGKCENPNSATAKCTYTVPEKIELTAISDSRCQQCAEYPQLVDQLSQIFKGLEQTKTLDYLKDAEAKTLLAQYKINNLPAFIVTSNIKKLPAYQDFAQYTQDLDDQYVLIKSPLEPFDPSREICDNKTDDNNDGRIDCQDPTCTTDLTCRQEKAARLDVFVMSQCPFGIQALDAMKEVLKNFNNQLDFHINYIASQAADGSFNSLHGPAEVTDDMRELCVIKYYPKNYEYLNYIWCRHKDIKADNFESCLKENNMNVTTISKCVTNEGPALLAENIKAAQDLNISASPTWLANNRYTFSGVSAEDVKKNFCEHNQLAGCKNTLSSSTKASGSCN